MIGIELTNINLFLTGPLQVLNEMREDFKYRHPNAFFINKSMPGGRRWDGYVHPISERGVAAAGFFPKIIAWLEERDIQYRVKDNREVIDPQVIKKKVGPLELRPYQGEAIRAIINNYVGGVYYPRGVISAATNAGKTLILAATFLAYKNVKGLILLNDSNLYRQFLTDMPKIFGDKWGYCQGKKIKFGQITVAMVQTLVNHLHEYKRELFNIKVLLVDECDLSVNKTYKKVLGYIPNAFVRVGLSGTVFIRNLAKDRVKNQTIIGLYGHELFKIKNLELMEKGYSTPLVVKISPGNTKLPRTRDYDSEYRTGITLNMDRLNKAIQRLKFYLDRNTYPILVVCKYHEHVEFTHEHLQRHFGTRFRVNYVHNDSPDKLKVIEYFRHGEIDILVSSLLIKRGQNLPLIKVIINLGGGDGPENVLQIIGRGLRTHESKEKVYYEDFMDLGDYLSRHSRHRISYYKNEGFKVILLGELKKSKSKPRRKSK